MFFSNSCKILTAGNIVWQHRVNCGVVLIFVQKKSSHVNHHRRVLRDCKSSLARYVHTLARLSIGKNCVYELWSGSLLVVTVWLPDSSFLCEAIPGRVTWLPIFRVRLHFYAVSRPAAPAARFIIPAHTIRENRRARNHMPTGCYSEREPPILSSSTSQHRAISAQCARNTTRRDVSNFYTDRGLRVDMYTRVCV